MQPNPKIQFGFTLIEMIMVMVIAGILGGIMALMINGPAQGYVDSARRAEMTDIGDTALSRITRDLRIALPNSERISAVGATYYLEFIPTTGGGAISGVENVVAPAPGVTYLDALGPITSSGVSIVINNTAANGASSVYSGWNVASYVAATTDPSNNYPAIEIITPTAPSLFPTSASSVSPGNRYQLISTPVTYVCAPDPTNPQVGTLTRYWGYALQNTQPISFPTASSAVLASNVSACNFANPATGLVTLYLTITESGESISLYSAANIANVP